MHWLRDGQSIILGALAVFGMLAALAAARKIRTLTRTCDRQHHLAGIINCANEGIYVTDTNRRFVEWNEAAMRISGYRREDVIGRHCHDNILSHTDEQGNALCSEACPLQHAMESGATAAPGIIYLRHREGRRVPVEIKTAPLLGADGSIIGGIEVFHDVSERLEQDRLLRERTRTLETLLNNTGDGILLIDASGRITVMNNTLISLFGATGALHGAPVSELDAGSGLGMALHRVADAYRQPCFPAGGAEAEQPPFAYRERKAFRCWHARSGPAKEAARECAACRTFQDRKRYLESPRELPWNDRSLSVASSFIEGGTPPGSAEVVLFHDVTAEKLDAALSVAGAAAHELRQPLQIILSLLQIMSTDPGEQHRAARVEGRDDRFDAIMQSCHRMNGIINTMTGLTSYRTKPYIDGVRILDIGGSSQGGGGSERT